MGQGGSCARPGPWPGRRRVREVSNCPNLVYVVGDSGSLSTSVVATFDKDGQMVRFLLIAVLFLISGRSLSGQEIPLKLNIESVVPQSRSHAPVLLEVRLGWEELQLLEGELQLKFVIGETFVAEYHSHELVVPTGGLDYQVTIPHFDIESPDPTAQIKIHARFVTRDGEVLDLEADALRLLVVPAPWRRVFVIGVTHPLDDSGPAQGFNSARNLLFEQFDPQPTSRINLSTLPALLPPESFPAHSLRYCSFDMLLLTEEGFPDLRSRQLDAIFDWVNAGGSVCVVAKRTLGELHIDFLNRLAGSDPIVFMTDDSDRLVQQQYDDGLTFRTFRTGLGRSMVALGTPAADALSGDDWRQSVADLWKFRAGQKQVIRERKYWSFDAERQGTKNTGLAAEYISRLPFAPSPLSSQKFLKRELLPSQIEGVPFGVIVGLLFAYLIVIGPVDYFVLGYFKCRRFTWILFFSVSLLFTAFTSHLASRYMGHRDYANGVVVIDVDERGAAIRSTRVDLVFTGSQRVANFGVKDAIHRPFDLPVAQADSPSKTNTQRFVAQSFQQIRIEDAAYEPPVYHGSLPVAYEIQQRMRQWTPRMSRMTSLARREDAITADLFADLTVSEFSTEEGRQRLKQRFEQSGESGLLLLMNQQDTFPIDVGGGLPGYRRAYRRDSTSGIPQIMAAVSAFPELGLFALVSRLSPTATSMEDLSLLDRSDERQWLLMWITKAADDFVVVRRLFEEES